MEVRYEDCSIIAEGKTKVIRKSLVDDRFAILEAKDDITAGDGAKHDVIAGKAELATTTTCNVFKLLRDCEIPVAFRKQLGAISFLADRCKMLPYEVVVRREAHGSFLKRHPHITKGHVFPQLILEFFLKTKNRQWNGQPIPKDDPLVHFWGNEALLYLPDVPLHGQESFLTLHYGPDIHELLAKMGNIAKRSFLVLEKAWQLIGGRLVDFKVEFGLTAATECLLLADVIDNDSWRLIEDGRYLDKQVYREGAPLNVVTENYQRVAELTKQFSLPYQQVVLWRGSEKDDLTVFRKALGEYQDEKLTVIEHTRSLHKEPVCACRELVRLAQEVPDTVIIAYVGRSNGAGPTLAANTCVPVITVPANWKEFPRDVWSSLRAPSDVPVLTVLDPANAVLAALQILAMRNPRLYALLRIRQEERFVNVVVLT